MSAYVDGGSAKEVGEYLVTKKEYKFLWYPKTNSQ